MSDYKLIRTGRRDPELLAVDPEDLLRILKRWRLTDPEKYRTMVEMICFSAGVNPADLVKKKSFR